jgi:hypothetical protein
VRDAALNECVSLPIVNREALKAGTAGPSASQAATTPAVLGPNQPIPPILGFAFLAGQPEEVRREFEEAMGIVRTS